MSKSMQVKGAGAFVFLLALTAFLPTMTMPVSAADEAVCVFISEKDNAWVVRKDSSVKSSLKVGDALYSGDQLIVTRGNNVQLAFDKDFQNTVQIEGDSALEISGSRPTNIELSKGRVFAILNKRGAESQFKVFTPTAIAAVRGTQYQVNIANQGTQVNTYQGEVRVSGRDKNGRETSDYVSVNAGQKTVVKAVGEAPQAVQSMTEAEKGELTPVLERIQATKSTFKSEDLNQWFPEGAAAKIEPKKITGDDTGKYVI